MNDQPVRYIFKLRQNIQLEGDLTLAQMELAAFLPENVVSADVASVLSTFPDLREIGGLSAVSANVRAQGSQFFVSGGPLALLPVLIRRLSFVQMIYGIAVHDLEFETFVGDGEARVGPVLAQDRLGSHLVIRAIPHYTLIEMSDTVCKRSRTVDATQENLQLVLAALLGRTQDSQATTLASAALAARSSTSHLSHDIHYYKAKFFPRMVRSMLNVCSRRLGGEQHRVIDNFAGSGTTLLESALLGMPSVGLDIDPLSVLISRTKLDVARFASESVARAALQLKPLLRMSAADNTETPAVAFPDWLLKNRKMTSEMAETLSNEIRQAQRAITCCDPALFPFLSVLLSDAISRRVRMRFLGTGVGRFALSFSRTTLPQMMLNSAERYAKVVAVFEWLRDVLQLPFAEAQVVTADTRAIPEEIGNFDILVTSPPYLPASSGRESYAKARALSLLALQLADVQDVNDLVDVSIGSMDNAEVDVFDLTPQELETVRWLQNDPLRAIKATPTARYFLDMRQTFAQMYRILKPGGLAVMVSGQVSTFYEFSTRRVLHVVRAAELLADEARRCGFEVEALHSLQLQKSNANARPRSLDDYYETLIFLRKPDR